MKKETKLGTLPFFGGLSFSFVPSALLGFLLIWAILSAVVVYWLHYPLLTAVLLGLAATTLHWLSEFLHNLGHAWAAHRTGYPMTGIRFYAVLAASLYPPDEPALPGRVHIRRALGGPIINACLSLLIASLFPSLSITARSSTARKRACPL